MYGTSFYIPIELVKFYGFLSFGFPYISWISIYIMDFHIFHGFPYIFMEFYKILQLLTIINEEDICKFFQYISEKIITP